MKSCENCGSKTDVVLEEEAKNFRANLHQKNSGNLFVCAKCKTYFEKRQNSLQKVLDSAKSKKRLIIAGPGTGKTYTFVEVAKSMRTKKVLIFTLIKNLAEELERDFADPRFANVETKTFHGYCKKLLYEMFGYHGEYYQEIPLLIEDDSQRLNSGFNERDFREAFANLDESNPALEFFLSRSSYYETIGHDDSVYKVYHHFLENEAAIPRYDLVIADEYQDFNKLESSFIDLLTKETPILAAGDDDQALYGFRKASTEFIRSLYKDTRFENLFLPFSTRCTNVLVNSVNHLVNVSKAIGLLPGRIDEKEYASYWPDKYALDLKYPVIQVANCSTPHTAELFIKVQIENITKDENLTGEEKDIQFLIIGAESQHRLQSLASYLRKEFDKNLYEIEVKEERKKITIEEGFHLIRKNRESNLGWRIVTYIDPPAEINDIIEYSYSDGFSIFDLLPKEYIERYLVKIDEYFSGDEDESKVEEVGDADAKKIRIKITNCLGAKGLSALHVLVTEFHNGVFPSDRTGSKITDEDIFRCIVVLTRAKRSCSLITFKQFDRGIGKSVYRPSKFISIFPEKNLKKIICTIKGGKLFCSN